MDLRDAGQVRNTCSLMCSSDQGMAPLKSDIPESIFPVSEELDTGVSLASANIKEYKNEQKTQDWAEWISSEVSKFALTVLSPVLSKSTINKHLAIFNENLNEIKEIIDDRYILFSISKCWGKAHCMKLTGWLLSDKDLMQKAEIKLAKGVDHRYYELYEKTTRKIFGSDNVLSTARNIATKEVLEGEADKKAYVDLRNTISEKAQKGELISVLGMDKSYFVSDFIDPEVNFEPKSANRKGVCFSASMHLIGKIIQEPELSEEILIQNAKELEKGVPAKVAAIQEVYGDLKPTLGEISNSSSQSDKSRFSNKITNFLCKKAMKKGLTLSSDDRATIQKIVEETIVTKEMNLDGSHKTISFSEVLTSIFVDIALRNIKNFMEVEFDLPGSSSFALLSSELRSVLLNVTAKVKHNDYNPADVVAHLYKLERDDKGTGEAKSIIGSAKGKSSSKEHLKNLALLNPGAYQVSFKMKQGAHSIVYMNIKGNEYLFDPNYGLIKCNKKDPSKTFLKLLARYSPPSDRLHNEDDDRNYRLKFTKYRKSASNGEGDN